MPTKSNRQPLAAIGKIKTSLTKIKMSDKRQLYNLNQWLKLNDKERHDIVNHIWNPYEPSIALITKSEIVDYFIKNTKIDGIQYGIKSFGWTVYMIYVIVNNSKQRVPKTFLSLPVNKGLIINYMQDNKAIVKFNYGGTSEIDLCKKIQIL